jgi:hypothetical protein
VAANQISSSSVRAYNSCGSSAEGNRDNPSTSKIEKEPYSTEYVPVTLSTRFAI